MSEGLLPRFIKDLNLTQPEYNFSDRVWQFPMRFGPNPKDWTMVHVTLYKKTYYCYWSEWDLSLELSAKGKIKKPAYWSLSNGIIPAGAEATPGRYTGERIRLT